MAIINFTSLLVFMACAVQLVHLSFAASDEIQFCSSRRRADEQKNQLRNGSNWIIIIKNALVPLNHIQIPSRLPRLCRREGKAKC